MVGGLTQVVALGVGFWGRTVFITTLGANPLSLIGVLTNWLALLSVAEAGIGASVTFALYGPLAKNDFERVRSILLFARRGYRIALGVMLVVGLAATPLMIFMVRSLPDVGNILLIYGVSLANMLAGFIWLESQLLLNADQQSYVVSLFKHLWLVLQTIAQIVALMLFESLVLYLLVQLVATLAQGAGLSVIVARRYGRLWHPRPRALDREDARELWKNVRAVFSYRLGAAVLNSSDNLIIAGILSASMVGPLSNYVLIVNSINSVLMQALNSLAASIGRISVSVSNERGRAGFLSLFYVGFFLYGVAAICLALLLQPAVRIWLGTDFLLSDAAVWALASGFFVTGINQIPSLFRTSMGFFRQAQLTPIVAAGINLGLSVILGLTFGLEGVLFATVIAKACTFGVVDPWLVLRRGFGTHPLRFYVRGGALSALVVCGFVGLRTLVQWWDPLNFLSLLGLSSVCFVAASGWLLSVLLFHREFRSVIRLFLGHSR